MSLIDPNDSFAVCGALFAIVFFALLAERTRLGRVLSASLISIAAGLLLANLAILPHEAEAYGFVLGYLVPLAIPLLLFKADVRRIVTETGPTLVAFCAGAVGTLVGAMLGFAIIDVGPETNKIAGVLTASFIGGSVNFVAVSQAVEIADASLISSAVAAQGVVAISYLSLLILAPGFSPLRRFLPTIRHADHEPATLDESVGADSSIELFDLAAAVSLSLIICAISSALAEFLDLTRLWILFVTLFAVAAATAFPRRLRALRGEANAGMLLIYVFFAVMGARSDIGLLAGTSLSLLAFLAVLLVCHCTLVLVTAKLFRLDLSEALTGSNACALGPSTAAAVAASQKWHGLVTPGILCGILGYVIANFVGVGLSLWLAG